MILTDQPKKIFCFRDNLDFLLNQTADRQEYRLILRNVPTKNRTRSRGVGLETSGRNHRPFRMIRRKLVKSMKVVWSVMLALALGMLILPNAARAQGEDVPELS